MMDELSADSLNIFCLSQNLDTKMLSSSLDDYDTYKVNNALLSRQNDTWSKP
jgi:hypothetical protein